jgi:hypothetical protein
MCFATHEKKTATAAPMSASTETTIISVEPGLKVRTYRGSGVCTDEVSALSPPKAEAARRWLVRYLSEGTPSSRDVAKVTGSLSTGSLFDPPSCRLPRLLALPEHGGCRPCCKRLEQM